MTALDYPAAHSMDATWFAVDGPGRVGVFNSGSNGPIPKDLHEVDPFAVTRQLRGVRTGDADENDHHWAKAEAEFSGRGLFVYEVIRSESDFQDPYTRSSAPEKPIHLDQLPPELRQQVAVFQLPAADFAADQEIQIIEHMACQFYRYGVAYFRTGSKEVRPIPGTEAEYARVLRALRKQYPKLRFADPPDAALKGKGKK